MAAAIEVSGLRKAYGSRMALVGLDFQVEEGEVFALLGPNGAGKTSTVEILEGFRSRDGGTVGVLGFDPRDRERGLRERIGIVLQETALDPFLTVAETVELLGQCYPRRREAGDVLALVGLTEQRDVRVRSLSGGQRRRVDVAVALVGDPDLIFLDEPTAGLDPAARIGAWEAIRGLARSGTTVLLTSHYLEEVQQLADRVAVICGGRVIAEGSPATIGGRAGRPATIRFRVAPGLTPPLGEPVGEGIIELVTHDPTSSLHRLTSWALERGGSLDDLEVTRPSLEEVYLELTREPSP